MSNINDFSDLIGQLDNTRPMNREEAHRYVDQVMQAYPPGTVFQIVTKPVVNPVEAAKHQQPPANEVKEAKDEVKEEAKDEVKEEAKDEVEDEVKKEVKETNDN